MGPRGRRPLAVRAHPLAHPRERVGTAEHNPQSAADRLGNARSPAATCGYGRAQPADRRGATLRQALTSPTGATPTADDAAAAGSTDSTWGNGASGADTTGRLTGPRTRPRTRFH